MTCPKCGDKTRVYCTRSDCETVKRWRKCTTCDYRYTTTEIETDLLKHITKGD